VSEKHENTGRLCG